MVHLQLPVTERLSHEELSLPISQAMTGEEAQQVIRAVNSFTH
jgi:dTDP-4-amino-4,6-dideoxygalactose transaminase